MTISLPSDLKRYVDKSIREGNFATTSEFFRSLIRQFREQQALADIEASERDIRAGKVHRLTLTSLRALRNK